MNGAFSDFAQGGDARFVIGIDRGFSALQDGAGTFAGQEGEREAIGNFFEAILDGDTSHEYSLIIDWPDV